MCVQINVQIPLSKPKQREFWDSTFDFTPKVSSDFHHASKFGIATQPFDGEDTGGVKGARSVFQRSRGSAKLILDKGRRLNEHLISSIKTAKARNDKQYHRACTAETRRKRIETSAKMEAEHLYHCLRHFFKENPKTRWEKNELQDALKEQYVKQLNSDFTAKKVITDTSKRNQTRLPVSYKFKLWVQHHRIFHRFSIPPHLRCAEGVKALIMNGSIRRSLVGPNSVFPRCKDPLHRCAVCGEVSEHDSVAEAICLCEACYKILRDNWWNPGGKGPMA